MIWQPAYHNILKRISNVDSNFLLAHQSSNERKSRSPRLCWFRYNLIAEYSRESSGLQMIRILIATKSVSNLIVYLRVPSNRVAIVSKNVFWGARSPLLAGIEGPEIRRHRCDSENNQKKSLLAWVDFWSPQMESSKLCRKSNAPLACLIYWSDIFARYSARICTISQYLKRLCQVGTNR